MSIQAQDQEVAISSPGCLLKGSLRNPNDSLDKSPKPLVIIIAGSGPTDRNGNRGNSYLFLANQLEKANIASFRYDKRGLPESEDSADDLSKIIFNDMVKDVESIVKYFKNTKKYKSIYLAGHSEGSLIAIIAAQRIQVDGVVSIAGAGSKAGEILEKQISNNVKHPEYKKRAIKAIKQLEKGQLVSNIDIELYAILNPMTQPYLIDWFKYDPVQEIKKLKIPVLIIQGDNDLQVGVDNAKKLNKAARKKTLKIIKNMNHVMKKVESKERKDNLKTYFDREMDIMPEVAQSIVEFISKNK